MVRYVFYTYSIKSSITGHLTDRLAIATLSRAPSSTAFLSYNPKIKIQKGCTRNDIHSSTAFDTFLNRLVFFNKAYNEATY